VAEQKQETGGSLSRCRMPFPGIVRESTIGAARDQANTQGLNFCPETATRRRFCKEALEKRCLENGQTLLGWALFRRRCGIGDGQKERTVFEQVFIGRTKNLALRLILRESSIGIRKQVENVIRFSGLRDKRYFISRTFPAARSRIRGCSWLIRWRIFSRF